MSNESSLPLELRLEMLGSVLEFMAKSGISESIIRESIEVSLARLRRNNLDGMNQRRDGLRMGHENISAELLRIWHRDARYIDGNAKPRPLALVKGRNNLRATIRRLDPTVDATEILQELKAVKLIRKTSKGRYLPTSESAIVGKLHPLAVNHIAKLVIRLVSTVSRNVDPAAGSLPLIERHAYAPDLSWDEREQFAEFTRTQGMVYLESVDNWLEQRRVRRAPDSPQRGQGVAASVHLFAHLGDGEEALSVRDKGVASNSIVDKPGAKTAKTRSKRSTASREARA